MNCPQTSEHLKPCVVQVERSQTHFAVTQFLVAVLLHCIPASAVQCTVGNFAVHVVVSK
jgi:hypothetical protein